MFKRARYIFNKINFEGTMICRFQLSQACNII